MGQILLNFGEKSYIRLKKAKWHGNKANFHIMFFSSINGGIDLKLLLPKYFCLKNTTDLISNL